MLRYFFIWMVAFAICNSCTDCHSRSAEVCPSPEDIRRCYCKPTEEGLDVKCGPFRTDKELKDALQSLKGRSLLKLDMSEHNATSFPEDLFEGLEIKDLSIGQFEVEDASFRKGKRHFVGLERSLKTLEITKSFRTGGRTLLNLQLGHLEKLEVLILEDNSIPEIGDDWFSEGPTGLNFLLLERNGVEELGSKAFSTLPNLKIFAVAGNHFRDVHRSMLPAPANQLFSIDLAHNNIRDLPADFFTDMPVLEEVNLSYNLIFKVQESTWAPVWSHLHTLQLEGNPLQCDSGAEWICTPKSKEIAGKCAFPSDKNGISLKTFCQKN